MTNLELNMAEEQTKKLKDRKMHELQFDVFKNRGNTIASLVNQFGSKEAFEFSKTPEMGELLKVAPNKRIGAQVNVSGEELTNLSTLFQARAEEVLRSKRRPGASQTLLGGTQTLLG